MSINLLSAVCSLRFAVWKYHTPGGKPQGAFGAEFKSQRDRCRLSLHFSLPTPHRARELARRLDFKHVSSFDFQEKRLQKVQSKTLRWLDSPLLFGVRLLETITDNKFRSRLDCELPQSVLVSVNRFNFCTNDFLFAADRQCSVA